MSDIADKIRVFVGTEPKTEIARKVLQLSIERRTETKVEFVPMIGREWEYSLGDITVGTGFSLRRWMIPAYCAWQGRAIYLDADQLVLGDIAELWNKPVTVPALRGQETVSAWMTYQPDKFYTRPAPQSSVMVIDCAKAKNQWGWHIKTVLQWLRAHPTKAEYADYMHCRWMTPQPRQIEDGWNGLNVCNEGKTRLVHYTSESSQPWYDPNHPLAGMWQKELMIAINNGIVRQLEFQAALNAWGKKEDWRPMNGLHPDYAQYLVLFPKGRPLSVPDAPSEAEADDEE